MRLKRLAILLLAIFIMLASGCWDMVEIEKRALISSIIIDKIEGNEEGEGSSGGNKEDTPFCEEKPRKIRVTFGIINPSKLQKGGEGGIIQQSVEAANLSDAMEKLGEKISRLPFYGHTRLLILTDKLLKDKDIFKQVMDEFERKPIINQQMKIVVFNGNPDDITKIDPKLESLQTTYITGIMENSKFLSNTISVSLHELITELRNNDGVAAIPMSETNIDKKSEFTIDKLALIKDFKLLTILDSKYIKTYKLVKGNFDSGRKLITYQGIEVPFYIFSADRRIWLEDYAGGLRFRIKIIMEGDIEQFEFDKLLFKPEVISDLEKVIDAYTIKELEVTTKHFQRDIGHDYLGLNEYTNKYHYSIFKKYEGNWDEAFKNAEIEYEVETKVRRIGTSRK